MEDTVKISSPEVVVTAEQVEENPELAPQSPKLEAHPTESSGSLTRE